MSTFQLNVDLARLFPETFNAELGLWTQDRPGHTHLVAHLKQSHSGRETATRLVIAAQLGVVDALPVRQALAGLRRLQWLDGSHQHGCFRWFAEEPHPFDTNAAFFIGLNLITLACNYREQLDLESQATLDAMLDDLSVWFDRESTTGFLHYPNKFLGDLVCAWLLRELTGRTQDTAGLRADMLDAARHWLANGWGWGEHLSDTYAAVILDELSALLLFAQHLPDDLRAAYKDLFTQLLALEDAFDGGPRVPAIRSYAFKAVERRPNYRDLIKPWTDGEVITTPGHFCHLFHSLGWHRLAPPRAARPATAVLDTPCHGGAVARSWITPQARLGTVSNYPLMDRVEHPTWGLSWQSMPVAFAAGSDGWGFLRWHAKESGVDRFHPARDKNSAYLHNALSDMVVPPMVGRTFSLQDGPDAVVLRRMPALSRQWETLADQLVLTGNAFDVVREESGDEVSRLLIEAAGQPVTVFFFHLGSNRTPRIQKMDSETVWTAQWTEADLRTQEQAACLWMICWGRDVPMVDAPVAIPDKIARERLKNDGAWSVVWPRASGAIRLVVDPLAAQPLTPAT